MKEKIKVLVNGAHGRMGKMSVQAIQKESDFEVVAQCGRGDNLEQAIVTTHPDVVLELTLPECVYENALLMVKHHVHPVIGASGLTFSQIETLEQICLEKKLGGIIAPNFSLASALMIQCTQKVAKYLPQAEIIEMHHDGKIDAPSATAIKTAQVISSARESNLSSAEPTTKRMGSLAYGEAHFGIPIHSIRLPGFVAHQRVLFGGEYESLTIQHDSLGRECFMPGVLFSCRKVLSLNQLIYGLDHLLEQVI